MMSPLALDIAKWAHGLEYQGIPDRVMTKASLQTFSMLAAMNAGARHEIGEMVLAAVESWAGEGPCTLIPGGRKADMLSAAYANSALSMTLDYDDYLLFGHTGHSAVCASLAVAEKERRSVKAMLTAQVIANEVTGRLGAGVLLGPHNGQGWSHIHLAGAAVAAAKLMELSVEQTAHAMAISLYQPTYVLWPGFMGPDSKTTTAATPIVAGLIAAVLASKGATGPLDIIEHPQGYLARMSYVPAPFFISGLGRAWVTDTLAYKIYPGCAYIDTSVDAVLKIMREHKDETGEELRAEDVSEVLVEATILTKEMDALSKTGGAFDPLNPVSINFSIPGNLAIALLRGRLDAEDFSKEALINNAESILEVSRKVRLVHDWSLTLRLLESFNKALNIGDILKQLKSKDLIGMRARAKEHYSSSMGLSLSDVKEMLDQAPQVKGMAWEGVKSWINSAISGGAPGAREKFDLGSCALEEFTMPFASRVTVTRKDGHKMSATQEIPFGGPGYPLDKTTEFVLDKYRREAGKNISDNKINELSNSAQALHKLSLQKFIELCIK